MEPTTKIINKAEMRKKIQEVANKIAAEFKPEKIILFGSWAWGEPNEDSDVDLFVVKETDNTREVAMAISGSVMPRPFPMDIIVYRPASIGINIKLGNFFIRNIMTKGKVLYG